MHTSISRIIRHFWFAKMTVGYVKTKISLLFAKKVFDMYGRINLFNNNTTVVHESEICCLRKSLEHVCSNLVFYECAEQKMLRPKKPKLQQVWSKKLEVEKWVTSVKWYIAETEKYQTTLINIKGKFEVVFLFNMQGQIGILD